MPSSKGQANGEWGKKAEELAVELLIKDGYTIRERNWRVGNHIEIDIIAQFDSIIAFVEVKARKENIDDALEAVDNRKRKKMVKGADIYLRQQKYDFEYRFDIITIVGDSSQYEITHIPDAFFPTVNNR